MALLRIRVFLRIRELRATICRRTYISIHRGDQSSVEFLLAVVPPHTECVVFSIDGSFAASMSVSGKDPKVRPGAVDICR